MIGNEPTYPILREFERRKAKNESYSLRAFARDLGLTSGRLSQYFSGKRRITIAVGRIISENLGLSPTETGEFFRTLREKKKGDPEPLLATTEESRRHQLDQNNFDVIAVPLHLGLLSLMDVDNFEPEAAWMAGRLNVSRLEVELCLARLQSADLITRTATGWEKKHRQVETSDGVLSNALRRAHRKILEETLEAQQTIDLHFRDITSMCLTIDSDRIEEAKEMIRKFRDAFTENMESGKRTEVYRLNIQLMPLTNVRARSRSGRNNKHRRRRHEKLH